MTRTGYTDPQTRPEAIALVVAPDGQAGGGMGRVKDILVAATPNEAGGMHPLPLVTRDNAGVVASFGRLGRAMATIVALRWQGRLRMIHVNFGDRGSAVRKGVLILLTRAIGVPIVLHLHAVLLEDDYRSASPWLRWAIRQPFRAATRVIVLGERWRHWLADDLGIAEERIHVVWNGVPIDAVTSRVHDGSQDLFRIVFVGNLLERKGVSDLLAALALLKESQVRWHARLLGGGAVPHYRGLADALDLSSEQVAFEGWVDYDQTRAAIATADMLVLPSYQEGLPLVILEALGLGTPVLCTPVGAIPEVLTDGVTALFCTPGDVHSIAAALARLIEDPALRAHLSDNGIALFHEKFSVEAFRRSVFAIWASVAQQAEPGTVRP